MNRAKHLLCCILTPVCATQGNSSLGGCMGWVASEQLGELAREACPTMASGVVGCGMGQALRLLFWQVVVTAAALWSWSVLRDSTVV